MVTKSEAFICAIVSFSFIVLPGDIASRGLANKGDMDGAVVIKGISTLGWVMVGMSGMGVLFGSWGGVQKVDLANRTNKKGSKRSL